MSMPLPLPAPSRRAPAPILAARLAGALIALLAGAIPAWAHAGHHDDGGLVQGLLHPMAGLDHLVAMVVVGLWAVALGARALWALPLAFLGALAAGAVAGLAWAASSQPLPLDPEPLVLASVVALSLAVAAGWRPPLTTALMLVVAVGVVHGLVHGLEAPPHGRTAFLAGMALGSAILHALGLTLVVVAHAPWRRRLIRLLAGAGLATSLVLAAA